MTATLTEPAPAPVPDEQRPDARPAGLVPTYRFELVKQFSQWRVRIALAVAWVAPAVFALAVAQQTSVPADTVFGRWLLVSGWAAPLVVLGFACVWAMGLLTSLVCGDAFAVEDRLGTWRHLMMTIRSPRTIFVAKVAASLTVVLLFWLGLAVSGLVGGLVAVGPHPLPGLDGHLLDGGEALRAVALSWVAVLAPTLAFAGIGLLGSVVLGRSPMGLLLPAVAAVVFQMLVNLPMPAALRLALPTNSLFAWRGLYTEPAQTGPLVDGIVVALVWAAVTIGAAYVIFVRRDFTDIAYDGGGRRALVWAVAPVAAVIVLGVLVLVAATPVSGSGIDRAKLERSLATSFAHLYRYQTDQLHRPAVTESQLRTSADCDKGGTRVDDVGPGTDWRCVVSWHLPGSTTTGHAIYQLNVTPDGRYAADGDGPKEVNGYFVVHTPSGDAPNPLWQFDGTVDLQAESKG